MTISRRMIKLQIIDLLDDGEIDAAEWLLREYIDYLSGRAVDMLDDRIIELRKKQAGHQITTKTRPEIVHHKK